MTDKEYDIMKIQHLKQNTIDLEGMSESVLYNRIMTFIDHTKIDPVFGSVEIQRVFINSIPLYLFVSYCNESGYKTDSPNIVIDIKSAIIDFYKNVLSSLRIGKNDQDIQSEINELEKIINNINTQKATNAIKKWLNDICVK
jgi:hypothetical protein